MVLVFYLEILVSGYLLSLSMGERNQGEVFISFLFCIFVFLIRNMNKVVEIGYKMIFKVYVNS